MSKRGVHIEAATYRDRRVASTVVVFFAIATPLSFWAANAPRGADWVGPCLASAAAAAFGIAGLGCLQRLIGWRRGSPVVAVVLLSLFNWRLIGEPIRSVTGSSRDTTPAVLVVLMLVIAYRFGNRREVQLPMMVMATVMVGLPVVGLISWYAGGSAPLPAGASDLPRIENSRSDVHVVVVDGYGRSDVLASLFGYRNGGFESMLEAEGFVIPRGAHSNFSTTAPSISSAWLGDLPLPQGDRLSDRERVALHRVIGGENPTVKTFQDAGYRYVHVEGGWIASSCGPTVDTCVHSSILDEAMWALIDRSATAWWFEHRFGHSFSYNGLRALDSLIELEADEDRGGRLTFTHVVLPHPPLLVDASCSVSFEFELAGQGVGRPGIPRDLLQKRRLAYSDQVTCVNDRLLTFVSELEPDDVVVIFGDHGPDSLGQLFVAPDEWSDQQIRERMAIFAAIRLPGCDDVIPNDWSPVNGLRLVLGCLSGQEIPMRDGPSYILPMDASPGRITEVAVPGA